MSLSITDPCNHFHVLSIHFGLTTNLFALHSLHLISNLVERSPHSSDRRRKKTCKEYFELCNSRSSLRLRCVIGQRWIKQFNPLLLTSRKSAACFQALGGIDGWINWASYVKGSSRILLWRPHFSKDKISWWYSHDQYGFHIRTTNFSEDSPQSWICSIQLLHSGHRISSGTLSDSQVRAILYKASFWRSSPIDALKLGRAALYLLSFLSSSSLGPLTGLGLGLC